MGTEIERKFLVAGDDWRTGAPGTPLRQGYLSLDPDRTVRLRTDGRQGWLTIKGRGHDAVRPEYEYVIPLADADEMLDRLCLRPLIAKTRHRVPHAGQVWEVDVFGASLDGLVMAEAELPRADHPLALPSWVGREVTGDPRYTNAGLVKAGRRPEPEGAA